MTGQPETELTNDEPLDSDEAVLEQLARRREEPAQEGAEAEEEAVAEVEAEESVETEEVTEEVEEDPEIDLGDEKVKKSQIKAWKQGEMKDADYRRKTAEIAEATRQVRAKEEQIEQERTRYVNQLDPLISQLQTELIGSQQDLAQLAQHDPAEWVRQNALHNQKFQRLQQAIGERQAFEQRAKDEKDRKHADWVRTNSEALQAKLPEWKDESARVKELSEMETFLRNQGIGDEDMGAFLDHRVYLLARKAWQAEKRDAARNTAKDKQVTRTPPKPLKAGAAQSENQVSDAYTDALKRAKSGKEEDLMALMAAKRRNA